MSSLCLLAALAAGNGCDVYDASLLRDADARVGRGPDATDGMDSGASGACDGRIPRTETCNGDIDDDCDGRVDENLTRTCTNQQGVCKGAKVSCDSERGMYPSCGPDEYGPDYEVSESSCGDALDNDCDGTIDEGCECSGGMRPCGTDVGECEQGMQSCQDGRWGECMGAKKGGVESCNDKDDDCDESVDEELTRMCPHQVGVCNGSEIACEQGMYPACGPDQYGAEYESLEKSCGDGLDNDCDGDEDCADESCDYDECAGDGTQCDTDSASCNESDCRDMADNDGDGDTDCKDSDCDFCGDGATCYDNGSCEEWDCNDGDDNDSDFDWDCEDDDCDGRACEYDCSACPGWRTCTAGECNCTNAILEPCGIP